MRICILIASLCAVATSSGCTLISAGSTSIAANLSSRRESAQENQALAAQKSSATSASDARALPAQPAIATTPKEFIYPSPQHPQPMSGTAIRPAAHSRQLVPQSGCPCGHHGTTYHPMYPQYSTSGDCGHFGTYCNTCNGNGSCFAAPAGGFYTTATPRPSYVDTQEYVYDGGDRDPQARIREDLSIDGLDAEDTIIRYETQGGSIELQSGCRVPIYSPRFSAVRKVQGPTLSEKVQATQATLFEHKPTGMGDVLPANQMKYREVAARDHQVKVIEALRDRNRGVPIDIVLPAIDISDAFLPFEDITIIRIGQLLDRDMPVLRRGTSAALQWSNAEDLNVTINNVAALAIESEIHPEELMTYELGSNRVRLCKVASHQVANPGDIIDFTIRFDNTGDQKISNILVQDSLSPRLEYVDGSAKCNLEAKFRSEPNDAGSSVLSWEIQQQVAPGEGGFLRFQCRIR